MSAGPDSSEQSAREGSDFDRRQFLTATGVVGASFLAGAASATLTDGFGLPVLGSGGSDPDPVRLGAVYLRGGPAEPLGPGSVAEAKLAVEEVNDAGGINGREVELALLHEGLNPVYAIETLVEEFEVDALLGLSTSAGALKAAPTIEERGLPCILTDVGTPFVTEYDTDTYGNYYGDGSESESESESASEAGTGRGTAAAMPNVFRTGANTSINTYAMASFAEENLDATRVANLGPDTLYGRQAWDYFRAYADGLGADYEYVASAFPASGAGDMTQQIDAVLDADPDLVFTSFWAGDAVTFLGQAVERGLFDQVDDVFDTLGADPRVFKALGDAMPEGIHYSSWYWHTAFDNEHNDAFVDAWRTTYYLPEWHEDESNVINLPTFSGGSVWTAVFLYKQAMEAVGGTNPGAVVDELEGASFQADPRGPTTIDPESHQATAPAVIGETSRDAISDFRRREAGVGLGSTETYTLDRSTATSLLEGSGLPPGV